MSLSKVLFGWSLFAGTHMAMSHPPIRQGLVDQWGKEKFLGIYTATSLVTFIPMCYLYSKARKLPSSQILSPMVGLGTLFNTLGVITFSQAVVNESPTAMDQQQKLHFNEGDHVKEQFETHGLIRVTRHGLFMTFAMFGKLRLFNLR
jgi:uncharacterized membrane protein